MNKLRLLLVDDLAGDFIDKNSMKYALVALLMNEQAWRSNVAVHAA